MQDGIYKVYLEGGGVTGFMIGTLADGRLTGCDQTHHVPGWFKRDGSKFTTLLKFTRHDRPEGFVEIANLDDFEVEVSGICGASFGQFKARIVGKPELPVLATFQRLCGF